jgi:glutamine cyclotransferase
VSNKYRVINTYPHDRDAFTQGLFYDAGVLYEGTGQETGSSLREVELTTGKVLRQLNLEPPLFGEGITLFGDRIYQVTWRSKVGFVYEKATFRQINRIYYQSEGWGLTTMNDRIVMSDGTNVLRIMDPEMFTVVSRLEVYDNEKKAGQLNELEYIDGEIWANMWMTDLIARIDPVSGRIIGYIDLKGILKDPETDTSVDVLNGIAYDREGNRIFVTGKNWPKLFEIKITE